MSSIIDVHSHYMPPEVGEKTMFFKRGWSDLERQISVMDEQGINQSLLIYPTSDAHLNMSGWDELATVYNDKISEVVTQHSDRFIGAGIVPFGIDATALSKHLKSLNDQPISALSLASSYDGTYLDNEYFHPVYEAAEANGWPIHVHAQIINPIGEDRVKDPLLSPVLEYVMDVTMCLGKMMMEGTLAKFPDVNFIFPHYGGVLPLVKERFDNTYQMLRKRDFVKDLGKLPGEYFKNLYFDTSGSKSAASLLCALEVVDASHILYGSDFPATQDMNSSIDVILNSDLSDDNKSAILSGNAASLFNKSEVAQ